MTKCEYLTARCPTGCEVWLHPKAVTPHETRCPGHPWTDRRRPASEFLLGDEAADQARQLCPAEYLREPEFSSDRILNPRPGMYLRVGITTGIVVRSPLDTITGRRWWAVLRAAAEQGRPFDPGGSVDDFLEVEQFLGLQGNFVRCIVCGDDVKPRGLKAHRRSNSVCRYLADIAEVQQYWALGYRDPYRLQDDGVPITWTELNQRACWRNRLHIVRFRLWTAVLISTASTPDPPIS